jgi:DNA-binding LacI/PurR family transcriptional regulator
MLAIRAGLLYRYSNSAVTMQQTRGGAMSTTSSGAPRGPVTLRDLARRADLSVSAVSMALLDSPRISADTKARVRELADELGYVPNSAGRALRAQKSDAIALIVPNTSQHVFGHAYFMHVLTGVTEAANNADAQVSVSTNPDASHGMVAYERVMRSGSAAGAIVTSASVHDENIARLVASGIPVVLLGRYPHLADAVSVGIDDEAAGFAVTEHLISAHGRRSLLHISGPLDHQTSIDRRDGFVRAAIEHGVEYTVIEGDYSENAGREAIATAQTADLDRFDGLFAANDEMAFGAMAGLRTRGYAVPTQISIVGFDDFGLSRVTSPSITTMHVPAERMARLATERLFDLIAGERVRGEDAHVVLPVELVPRQSCGCEAL